MARDDENHDEPINTKIVKPNAGTFDLHNPIHRLFSVRNQIAREFCGEVLSTFMLVTFGCGSVAQMKLNNENPDTKGLQIPFLSVNFGFGFGVMLGVLVGGKTSGAHMNPAVSLAMLLTARLSPLRFVVYIMGQCVGAFLGAVVVFLVYLDAFKRYADRNDHTFTDGNMAGIFGTYPTPGLTWFAGLLDQFIGTALLVIVVLAVTDKKNVEMPHGTVGLVLGLTVFLLGTSFGHNCGYAVNPARDLMPRIFTALVGWSSSPFTMGNGFFWIPLVGPMIGAIFGTFVYILMISNNWPEQ